MAMDKIKAPNAGERTLPPYYYSVADVKLCDEKLSSGLSALNEALKRLGSLLSEVRDGVADYINLTDDDITAIYGKKISLCKELPLPSEVITESVAKWETEADEAHRYFKAIQENRKALEQLGAKIEYHGCAASITNKNEITSEAGKVYISDEDKELWRLLCNVRDSYRKYSLYADKHNKKSRLGIGQIFSISTPEEFIKSVALGHFDRYPTDMQRFRDDPQLVPQIKTKSNIIP